MGNFTARYCELVTRIGGDSLPLTRIFVSTQISVAGAMAQSWCFSFFYIYFEVDITAAKR
jgi:hypothetical protein